MDIQFFYSTWTVLHVFASEDSLHLYMEWNRLIMETVVHRAIMFPAGLTVGIGEPSRIHRFIRCPFFCMCGLGNSSIISPIVLSGSLQSGIRTGGTPMIERLCV